MFTGIVQSMAKIISINKNTNFHTHTIELSNDMICNLEIGSSISYNGCCLTVTKINNNYVSFDLIKETLCITNLGNLSPGDFVNIERSIRFNNEIGGHLMSGHIMNTAKIIKNTLSENVNEMWLKLKDPSLIKYVLYKGFIGIDGISLTVGKIKENCFCINLIPETLQRTTLGRKKIGQLVNIEIDYQTKTIVDTLERCFKTN